MLTNTERHHLTILAKADGNPVYHQDFRTTILQSLTRKRLIQPTPHGTYRITLLGLIEHRKLQGEP